jgi:hypothetical protein
MTGQLFHRFQSGQHFDENRLSAAAPAIAQVA